MCKNQPAESQNPVQKVEESKVPKVVPTLTVEEEAAMRLRVERIVTQFYEGPMFVRRVNDIRFPRRWNLDMQRRNMEAAGRAARKAAGNDSNNNPQKDGEAAAGASASENRPVGQQ